MIGCAAAFHSESHKHIQRIKYTIQKTAAVGETIALQRADGFQKLALTLHVLHVIQQLILGVTVYLDIPGASASAIVADKLVILDLVAVHHTHFLTTKSTNLLTKFLLKTNRQKT